MEQYITITEFHHWIESKDYNFASLIKYSRRLAFVPRVYGFELINDWVTRMERITRIKIKHNKMKISYLSSSGKKKKYSYCFVPTIEQSHRIEHDIYSPPELKKCNRCPYLNNIA
jgi:hypothetical protein